MNKFWFSKKFKKDSSRLRAQERKRLVMLAGCQRVLTPQQKHYAAEDAVYNHVRCPRSFRWYLKGKYWVNEN